MKTAVKLTLLPPPVPSSIYSDTYSGHRFPLHELTDAQLRVIGDEFTANMIKVAQEARAKRAAEDEAQRKHERAERERKAQEKIATAEAAKLAAITKAGNDTDLVKCLYDAQKTVSRDAIDTLTRAALIRHA